MDGQVDQYVEELPGVAERSRVPGVPKGTPGAFKVCTVSRPVWTCYHIH
jgi:hypothetical protein